MRPRVLVLPALALVAACNAISGIGDLSFNGTGDGGSDSGPGCGPFGNMCDSGSVDAGSDSSGADSADSSPPICPAGASVPVASSNPACGTCLQQSCCSQLTACAGDAQCMSERMCLTGCGGMDGDAGCIVGCRNSNACGLVDELALEQCATQSCASECSGDAGAPDAGACAPFSGPCNPSTQCGCSPGQNCVFNGGSLGGDTICVSVGSATSNHACAADTDCVGGMQCVDGACKAFCDPRGDCAAPSTGCEQVYLNESACMGNEPIFGDLVCSSGCNPVSPQGVCGPGLTCNPAGTTTNCAGPVGTGMGPGKCGSGGLLCAPGYDCLSYAYTTSSGTVDEYTCEHWCRIGAADCTSPELCTGFAPPITVQQVTYGTCAAGCDLINPSTCPSGSICDWFIDPNNADYADCVPSSGTHVGTGGCNTTQSILDCAPGYTCVVNGSSYDCQQWCRIGGSDCPAGKTCMMLTSPPIIKGVTYGVCG